MPCASLSFTVVLMAALSSHRESCDACSVKEACELHATEEARVVAAERPRLKLDDPLVRSDALRALGTLSRTRENAPSPATARLIATALEDPAPAVRAVAIEVLGQGQHDATAHAAFVGALDRRVRALEKLKYELPDREIDREDLLASAQRLVQQSEELVEVLDQRKVVLDEVAAIFRVLAAHDDAKSRELALRNYKRMLVGHNRGSSAALLDSLLAFGTRDVFRVAIDSFGDYAGDGQVTEVEMSGKKVPMVEHGDALHAALNKAVALQSLPEPTATSDGNVRTLWRRWLVDHGAKLPEE